VKNKVLAFDENREITINSMNQEDPNKNDVDMDIDDDKMPSVSNQLYDLPALNTQHDMDVDVDIETYKPQTDKEKIDYFNDFIMKNHKESLHHVDLNTFNDPLE
jgi:hypothetical protein